MIVFLVPAYNEEKNIAKLLDKTDEQMKKLNIKYRILIVNDGSTDSTIEVVESLKDSIPLDLYSYYPNKGVGEAFRRGFQRLLSVCSDEDIIITKEADNTSDLNILNQLIANIDRGYDVVLASCYAKGAGVIGTTLFRIFLSKCANFMIRLFFHLKDIHTYSSFYRAYRAKALKEIYRIYGEHLIEEPGFECMVELIIKFSRNKKFKITEVPMVLDGTRRVGKSKMQVLKTIKGFLKVILKESIFYRMKLMFKSNGR